MTAPALERTDINPVNTPDAFAEEHGLNVKLDSSFGSYRLIEFQLGPMRAVVVGDTTRPQSNNTLGFHDLIWVAEQHAEAHRQAALEDISAWLSGEELLDVRKSCLTDILTYRS